MGRSRAVVVGALSVVLSVLFSGLLPATALARPPDPPPNPSDDDLRRSHDAITQRADEVGRLTAQLADLDSRTDDIQAELAAQREDAEAALVELQGARAAADAAAARAALARQETEAATAAIDAARARVDEIVVTSYLQGLDLGPLGLLTQAASPEDLVARAEADDVVARNLLAVTEELERARVAKANADSTARALLDEARARESA
ncbi:periplasmic heavy metal sensor, partial [Pseudonocardia sp.]|uniref:periplasmic heavy metal sensor n=1 Tax=Pseudonocardia sp. TaxID=60912 RepID=UPI003D0E6456